LISYEIDTGEKVGVIYLEQNVVETAICGGKLDKSHYIPDAGWTHGSNTKCGCLDAM
jgi:hypothetical protein